jgi:hypothetical protein
MRKRNHLFIAMSHSETEKRRGKKRVVPRRSKALTTRRTERN